MWDPERYAVLSATPEGKAALATGMQCPGNRMITPHHILPVEVTTSTGGKKTVTTHKDPVSMAKRSAMAPETWILEPKGIRALIRLRERQCGDMPIPFGGHHQSLLAAAAARAATECFLCNPCTSIPGALQKLQGVHQVRASRDRTFMQHGRTAIRARRSADAA